jgi:uncharacterized protein (DUF1800 family)
MISGRRWMAACAAALLAGCAGTVPRTETVPPAELVPALNRLTWGVNYSSWQQARQQGYQAWLERQLRPAPAVLPPAVQSQIDAMTISQRPLDQLVEDLEQRRKEADKTAPTDEQRKAAQQAYQQELNRLAKEAASRSLLRAVYSPNQLQEQMTWFWMNHFTVSKDKSNIRGLVGDYEQTLRAHALGRFRDLLGATLYHPAMIRYLDNEQNAANRINENYARELMELHTLGVDGGYSQRDVQELARILTGVGINLGGAKPNVKKELADQYVRRGLFEFNPNRHDYKDKVFLGQPVKGRGLAEVEEALDRLSRNPATARFISRKLALYFVSDDPPPALVERMAGVFTSSDGDIASVMQAMIASPEFTQSLGRKFKDPAHYVVSAVRLAYDDKPILNTGPMMQWLQRMGEPLYGRATPDGYPLTESGWASSGQLSTRFEIAKAIGSGNAGLFKTDGPQPVEQPAFPQLANALYYQSLESRLGARTREALAQANSPQEWNAFLLSSPELMHR